MIPLDREKEKLNEQLLKKGHLDESDPKYHKGV